MATYQLISLHFPLSVVGASSFSIVLPSCHQSSFVNPTPRSISSVVVCLFLDDAIGGAQVVSDSSHRVLQTYSSGKADARGFRVSRATLRGAPEEAGLEQHGGEGGRRGR